MRVILWTAIAWTAGVWTACSIDLNTGGISFARRRKLIEMSKDCGATPVITQFFPKMVINFWHGHTAGPMTTIVMWWYHFIFRLQHLVIFGGLPSKY